MKSNKEQLHILIAHEAEAVLEVLRFILEDDLGAKVSTSSSYSDIQRILASDGTIDCVVSSRVLSDGNIEAALSAGAPELSRIPLVLLGADSGASASGPQAASRASLSISDTPALLTSIVTKLTKRRPTHQSAHPGYVRVSKTTLSSVSELPSDLLLRLSTDRFVCVAKKGDRFDLSTVERFEKKGVVDYYFKSDALVGLAKLARGELARAKAVGITAGSDIRAISRAVELIGIMAQAAGYTADIHEIASETINSTIQSIENHPDLGAVVTELLSSRDRYSATHCLALAHTSCAIAHLMGWSSATTFNKLATASLLHDIRLPDERFARVESFKAFEQLKSELSDEEINTFYRHPEEGAELVALAARYTPDVDKIILQHHERPDGTGFPRGLNHSQIHPLAAVFIVAQEVLSFFVVHGEDASLQSFIQSLPPGFFRGNFRRLTEVAAKLSVG